MLTAMAESAPTGRQEEGLWPRRGSREQCQVGLTSVGAFLITLHDFFVRGEG
jgi:hypothetical protein